MTKKKQFGEYYLGLDIGTASVGWAASDPEYNLLKLNGKNFWGSRLFQEGQTAEARRLFRSSRRRLDRKKQRLEWLKELFEEEINKVDDKLFTRLEESKYQLEDKSYSDQLGVIFASKKDEKIFYKKYPTIYHLRKAFIENNVSNNDLSDVRLLYLVLHHLLKSRGHFLLSSDVNFEQATDFAMSFNALSSFLEDEFDISWSDAGLENVKKILKREETEYKDGLEVKIKSMSDIQRKLADELYSDDNKNETLTQKEVFTFLAGGKGNLSKLFNDDLLKEIEKPSFSFKENYLEEIRPILESTLEEVQLELLDRIKAVYDWSVLVNILSGEKFISASKVSSYKKYKEELKQLKDIVKKLDEKIGSQRYKEIFKNKDLPANYCAYTGFVKINGEKINLNFKCGNVDFIKYLKDEFSLDIDKSGEIKSSIFLKNNIELTEAESIILDKIVKGTILQKLKNSDNGVIPNQIHRHEMETILSNAKKNFLFIGDDNCKDSVAYKLLKMMSFRVPYFVGPLNGTKDKTNFWMVRKEAGKIYPWNFTEKVDEAASSQEFIKRMLNYCTYIPTATVLPKQSMIYQKYLVLNELNNISIGGEKLSVELKVKIFDQLFLSEKKVTVKKLLKFLKQENINSDKEITQEDISGLVVDFTQSLSTQIYIVDKIGEKLQKEKIFNLVEEIIRLATIFGEDSSSKKLLEKEVCRINEEIGSLLSENEIKEILKIKFSGWAKFSKEFLTEVKGQSISGEYKLQEEVNIIDALSMTQANLMGLLSENNFSFAQSLQKYNNEHQLEVLKSKLSYDLVKDTYLSPSVKRSVWQALQIVEEIVKITAHPPSKIFIETTRSDGEKGKTTSSRKRQLEELYRSVKNDCYEINKQLKEEAENNLKSKRLFLYYQQQGKCMYSGRPIDINRLNDNSAYDIDHIYPRSKTKDNGWDNLVLVEASLNRDKKDKYPIDSQIQNEMDSFWKALLSKKFITKEKYFRLVRRDGLSDDELSKFIARQLIETSQANKLVKDLLKNIFDVDVVFSKASNVSDFRHEFNLLKCRDVNDLHHAHDAYLNIVVGNVYDTKFTRNPYNFVKNNKDYSLKPEIFWRSWNIDKSQDVNSRVWEKATIKGLYWNKDSMQYDYDESRDEGTIVKIRRVLGRPNVLVTKLSRVGRELFPKVTIFPKGEAAIPYKKGLDINKYGGLKGSGTAYFSLVEHLQKNDPVRTLEIVSVIDKIRAEKDLTKYFVEQGLINPTVIIPKIKIGQLLKVDGSLVILTGKSGDKFVLDNANQLHLDNANAKYLKKILAFCAFRTTNKNAILSEKSIITKEKNMSLYTIFQNKMSAPVYENIFVSAWTKCVEDGEETFELLAVENQCKVLSQLLLFFTCNSSIPSSQEIGLSVGRITSNKSFSKWHKVELIHQSITGIFEEHIELKSCPPQFKVSR